MGGVYAGLRRDDIDVLVSWLIFAVLELGRTAPLPRSARIVRTGWPSPTREWRSPR